MMAISTNAVHHGLKGFENPAIMMAISTNAVHHGLKGFENL